jgi:hypothetical protein
MVNKSGKQRKRINIGKSIRMELIFVRGEVFCDAVLSARFVVLLLLELLQRLRLGDFSVAKCLYHLQHFGPGRKGSGVTLFILIYRHKEFKLLIRHLSLFSRFSLIASASAGTSPAVQTQPPIDNTFSAVSKTAPLCEVFWMHQ